MKTLASAIMALGGFCATAAIAQTQPTPNLAPLIVQQQLQISRQQMYQQNQANALAITQEQTHMNQAVSGMAQQNQQILNSQLPPKPTPPMTGTLNR